MAKIKTSELTERQLDFLICKIKGLKTVVVGGYPFVMPSSIHSGGFWPKYSTDWSQGGSIIEREKIGVWWDGAWHAKYDGCQPKQVQDAEEPLTAAMRCYVASKLGDEVDVPEELCYE